ncbi:hypothetical protein OG756_19055 [Streptomyces sp. NBC_01310]|uniref:hypothetical protein n=1 Tax=Streptomyces sp. NBC_01310 TaxID=2903820 RepID=UPI0035B6506D|nr:hypothetical protein OG756_19055 [Streptomyces sp. NBC_01310]
MVTGSCLKTTLGRAALERVGNAAPRRKARQAPEPTTPSAPESSHSVSVNAALLRRAGQVLGTGDHEESVIAALSEIVAGRQQAAELVQLREQVRQIATIAGQALQGLTRPAPSVSQ